MLFVKGLGSTAQNIAKRKLLGCEIHTASTFAPCRPDTSNTVTASALISRYPLEQFPGYHNEIKNPRDKVEGTSNSERVKGSLGSHRWSLGCDKEFSNRGFCFSLSYSRACAEGFTCSDQGSKETGNKFGGMLLDRPKLVNQENLSGPIIENPQTTSVLQSRLENNCKFQPLAIESSDVSCFVQDKSQMQNNFMFRSKCVKGDPEAVCRTNEISYSSEAMKIIKSDQTVPLASGLVFNLPYLKTRFDQVNSSEQYRFLQQDSSDKKRAFSAQASYQGVLIPNPSTNQQTTLCSHSQQNNSH